MQLICPSCSKKHQTEDHPGAFEISCTCGYSLLIPDESAIDREIQAAEEEEAHLNVPLRIKEPTNLQNNEDLSPQDLVLGIPTIEDSGSPNPDQENNIPDFSSEPAAQEAQDEAYIISGDALSPPPGGMGADSSEEAGSLMTPPEELPPEMPYDRFEIPNFEEGAKDFTSRFDVGAKEGAEMPPSNESSNLPEKKESLTKNVSKSKASTAEVKTHRAQVIIEKSLRSSIGQLLGFSYDLKISGLSDEALKSLRARSLEFCHFRPWLGDEVKKRNISLDQLQLDEWLQNLPEGLAVEIYLKTLELGGQCQFHLST